MNEKLDRILSEARSKLSLACPDEGDNINELHINHVTLKGLDKYEEIVRAEVKDLVTTTATLNRMELAKDIKRRNFANDALRDNYLDSVIGVGQEFLDGEAPYDDSYEPVTAPTKAKGDV